MSDSAMWKSAKWVLANPTTVFPWAGVLLVVVGLFVYWINPKTIIDTAVDDYREAERRDALVKDHVRLGNALLDVQQPRAARFEFEAALKLEKTDVDASRGLFKTNIFEPVAKGQYDPEVAHQRLIHLLQGRPNDANGHAYLGDTLLQLGRHDAALAQYDAALKENKLLAHAYAGKGNVLELRGDASRALELYSEAVRLSPFSQRYSNNLAYQLFRAGRYADAITGYHALLSLDPRYLLPYYEFANALRIEGNLDLASYYQRHLLQLLRDGAVIKLERNQTAWFFHRTSLGKGEDFSGPEPVFLTTLVQKRFYAYLNHALTVHVHGERGRARSLLRRAHELRLDPIDAEAIRSLIDYDVALLARERRELARSARRFASELRSIVRSSPPRRSAD